MTAIVTFLTFIPLQNSQKIQQVATRSEICEFWAFYNPLTISALLNKASKKPFEAGGSRDLGYFTTPLWQDHHTV